MPGSLQVTSRDVPPLVVFDLQGQLVSFDDAAIADAYRQATEQGSTSLLLNFAGVDYITSPGIIGLGQHPQVVPSAGAARVAVEEDSASTTRDTWMRS